MDRLPDVGAPGETRVAVCPEHGEFESRSILGRLWTRCPICAEVSTKAEEDERRKAREERARVEQERRLVQSGIPARFINRTFDNFEATTDAQRHALAVSRDFADQFAVNVHSGKGLIFSGRPGTGKSHLAAAIMQKLLPHWSMSYMTCMDLIRSVRSTWRRDSPQGETEVLNELGRIGLLVVDEIGVQYGTDGEQTILFDVLDRRYRDVMPTILLTNQDRAGFEQFIGERAFDRLKETCRWVPFDWPSHRPVARKEDRMYHRLASRDSSIMDGSI